jgi:hypothetical protein
MRSSFAEDMKAALLFAFAAFWKITCSVCANEGQIDFSEPATKAFKEKIPLAAEVTRKDGMVSLRLSNVSPKHVVITKQQHSWGGHYEAKDGSKLEEFGVVVPATPTEFLDHVVLRPASDHGDRLSFSSWDAWEIEVAHQNASAFVFHSTFSGYFPTIGEYLTFTVSGRVELKPNLGEQGGAGQPATPATCQESDSEGGDKPQPESEGRSR